MIHVFAFIVILAIVAFANQFYIFGASVVLLIVVILHLVMKRSEKILNMYFAMPTVWQNIQETLEIGLKFGVIDKVVGPYRVCIFYDMMEVNEELFEIRVNEQILGLFELKYGLAPHLRDYPARSRALCYFVYAVRFWPERLPEILGAVQVRKKPHGKKKKDTEKEVSRELQPIYLA